MKVAYLHVTSAVLYAACLITNASAQSLEEIMQEAVSGSQALAADRATLDAQREAAVQARSAALPSLSLGGYSSTADASFDAGKDGDQFISALGFSDVGSTGLEPATKSEGLSLSARQTLFSGGRVRNTITAARAGVRAAEAGYAATVEDTVFEIISAYFDIVRAEEQSAALGQTAKTLREQEEAVEKSFELGRATKTDVVSVQAQRAEVESQLALSRAQINSARMNFQGLTGELVQAAEVNPEAPNYPDDIDVLLGLMTSSNANLQAAEALVEADGAEVKVARGQRLPAVELVGSYAYAEDNLIQGDSLENTTLQLQFSVPLFSGGRTSSEVRQAKAELRSSRFIQSDLNRRLEAAVRSAYGEARAAALSRIAAEQQLASQEVAYQGVLIEADLGQRTTLDILDAEDDVLASRFAVIDARIREHLSIYNLLRLTGTLSDAFGIAGQ